MTGAALAAGGRDRAARRVARVPERLADAGDPLGRRDLGRMRGVLLIVILAAQLWLGALVARRDSLADRGLVVLVLGHYADVTTPALYGRDINLYWDVRYMPDVAAMIAHAAPLWLIVVRRRGGGRRRSRLLYVAVSLGASAASPAAAVRPRRSVRRSSWPRRDGGRLFIGPAARRGISRPNRSSRRRSSQTYARQARLDRRRAERVAHARAEPADGRRPGAGEGRRRLPGLHRVVRRDRLRAARHGAAAGGGPRRSRRRRFTAPAATWSRRYVESPTFGGSSWLAHLSLMSGVEVRDPGNQRAADDRATRDDRDELQARGASHRRADAGAAAGVARGRVLRLRRHLRRVAPRLSRPRVRLVRAPGSVLAGEVRRARSSSQPSRAPRFVFFPTISTHFPFIPTPPYQPDWSRRCSSSIPTTARRSSAPTRSSPTGRTSAPAT